jgi:hypothetical protein
MQNSNRFARRHGNKPPTPSRARPRWTSEEIAILRRLYRTHSNAQIAEVLGRKISSVVFKGHRLGLSKGVRRLKEMGRENIHKRWHPRRRKGRAKASAVPKPKIGSKHA